MEAQRIEPQILFSSSAASVAWEDPSGPSFIRVASFAYPIPLCTSLPIHAVSLRLYWHPGTRIVLNLPANDILSASWSWFFDFSGFELNSCERQIHRGHLVLGGGLRIKRRTGSEVCGRELQVNF
ncbi:hypothetical protein IF1G_07181 [Cordyceps javanica]|uniref:Uncharacterized protein n=1 Tax=Cordyceps javanica TaxID=43265 RepID=A0A545UXV8_9HYPO|nr:hypothetical protein IF1G_07181 [Cordyceps javanica]